MPRGDKKDAETERADTMGTNVYSAKDNQSMHKSLNGEFILYQILLDQILNGNKALTSDDPSVYKYFEPDDPNDQRLMQEFDKEYQSSKAIFWYTKESPIYKILNKALRTQNIDDLVPFGQFIRDLNQQLSKEKVSFIKKQKTSILRVYRGQLISKDEVKRLKPCEGQLISVNSFLSTSTNRKKALEFATSRPPPNDELTSILLEINLDLTASNRPYADIKHLSAFPEEEEILLMFGSIFRIDKVSYDEKLKLWNVQLTLASHNDEDYQEYQASLKQDLKGQNQFVSIGNFFIEMQKYEEAEKHFEQILKRKLLDDPIELAYAHHGLATVNHKKGHYRSAIHNLEKSLDYLIKNQSNQDHPLISQCFNDLAYNHFKLEDHLTAFNFYEKALNRQNNILSDTYERLAEIHSHLGNHQLALRYLEKALQEQNQKHFASIGNLYILMGKIYIAMNNKEKASKMFDKAIETQLRFLPSNHPDIGYTYLALGLMFSQINDRNKALFYLEKAYRLQLETLPDNHLDFGQTFKYFGNFYMQYNDVDKALSFYHRALENELKTLQWNNPIIAQTYLTIASAHKKKKDYQQALIYYQKIVDSELTRTKSGDHSLTIAYENLANLYYEKDDHDQALVFYLKQLNNELFVKLSEDISLANLYRRIGQIYHEKKDLKQALIHYYRLLDCYFRKDGHNEQMIDQIYQIIGKIYLEKSDITERLLLYQSVKIQTDEDAENVYFEKRHLHEALNYFTKSLEQQKKTNSNENNQLISQSYQILGNIYYEKGDSNESLDNFIQVLNNEIKSKGFVHPSLIHFYQMVGKLCLEKGYYNQSLICFHRSIDCQRSLNEVDLTNTYQSIGKIYLRKDCFNQSSNYLNELVKKKSKHSSSVNVFQINFEFEERHLKENLIYFQRLLKKKSLRKNFRKEDIYWIIGNLHLEKEELTQSSIIFEKLLSYQHRKSSSSLSLAKTNQILGNIYRKQSRFGLSLERYEAALFFSKQIYSNNESLLSHLKYQVWKIKNSTI